MSLAIFYLCRMIIVGWKELSNVLGAPAISRIVKNHRVSEKEGALTSSSSTLWFYRLRNQDSAVCSHLSLSTHLVNSQSTLAAWLPNPCLMPFLLSQTISCCWASSGIMFRSMWDTESKHFESLEINYYYFDSLVS